MEKIIVTTDFSANSKRAMRFALQLAVQTQRKLIFYHVIPTVKKPSIWDHVYYGDYENEELKRVQITLERFVHIIHKEGHFPELDYECICELENNLVENTSKQIMNFAEGMEAQFICISTTGAGAIEKLFGTIPTALIIKSEVPVIVVPKNYRNKPLDLIYYASDMEDVAEEIRIVADFAKDLESKIKVLHYDTKRNLMIDHDKLSDEAVHYESDTIQFHYKKLNPKYTLNYHIKRDVKVIKPSLVVLFTKPNRKWFDRLFVNSHAIDLSLSTKVPLLIFRKKSTLT
jgi:nucleotide-binding universal stress UspA family protein